MDSPEIMNRLPEVIEAISNAGVRTVDFSGLTGVLACWMVLRIVNKENMYSCPSLEGDCWFYFVRQGFSIITWNKPTLKTWLISFSTYITRNYDHDRVYDSNREQTNPDQCAKDLWLVKYDCTIHRQ